MNITIICVGKLKEKYLKDGIEEYLKRLSKYCSIKIIEVDDEKAPENLSSAEEANIKKKEAEKIRKHIKDNTYLVTLCIEGGQLSSEGFAKFINDLGVKGNSDLTLLIGGSIGLAEELINMSDYKLSFSKMTFPHQLMRLILLEQIYRGFRIIKGEPYHK